jgi:hypothetical protein
MAEPIQMPSMKHAKAPESPARRKPFSLVPADAQRKMYKALAALKPSKAGTGSGAEVAEIAVCLAIDENDPVILACAARGARKVRKPGKNAVSKIREPKSGRLSAATTSAVAALLSNSKAAVVVCAGKLETRPEGQQDYRSAFSFAARHKLPILFLVADSVTSGRSQKPDLQALYAEFGIPVFSVDANDAIAAYRVTIEALHNARHLRGPCVIQALTVNSKDSRSVIPLELLRDYMERHGNWPL